MPLSFEWRASLFSQGFPGTHYIAQTSCKLAAMLLPQPPKCCHCRSEPPNLASFKHENHPLHVPVPGRHRQCINEPWANRKERKRECFFAISALRLNFRARQKEKGESRRMRPRAPAAHTTADLPHSLRSCANKAQKGETTPTLKS